MFKSIAFISLAMGLTACGGGGGGGGGDTEIKEIAEIKEIIEEEAGNPVFSLDASKLDYFAVKQGSGEWQEMPNSENSIEVTDTKGDLSTVTVCNINRGGDTPIWDISISHLRMKKDVTEIAWCEDLETKALDEVVFIPAQANVRISAISSKSFVGASFSSLQASATFSDLAGEHEIVASAYDYSATKVYIYRGTFSELKEGSTYSIDFFGEDAISLETFSNSEAEEDFSHSYGYKPAAGGVVDLYAGDSMQGKIPAEFLKEGDLFKHFYGFGSDSQITVLSNNQEGVNPLSETPSEYSKSDMVISGDSLSFSFTPKASPINSLIPSYHKIYVGGYDIGYTVNAERFSEFDNTLTLMDFSLLPNYPGDMPSQTISSISDIKDVTTYYSSEEKGVDGSQSLFISLK